MKNLKIRKLTNYMNKTPYVVLIAAIFAFCAALVVNSSSANNCHKAYNADSFQFDSGDGQYANVAITKVNNEKYYVFDTEMATYSARLSDEEFKTLSSVFSKMETRFK